MKDSKQINVWGAGVSGLTTAILLSEHGYKVKIITRELPEDTVSSVAAAIWLPYQVYPVQKVNSWSRTTLETYRELAAATTSGVSFIEHHIFCYQNKIPEWLDSLPEENLESTDQVNIDNRTLDRHIINIPLIETQIYLPYLVDRFKSNGGTFQIEEIKNPTDYDSKLNINCTGLGSRELFNDTKLTPIQGQVVKVEKPKNVTSIATDFHFGEHNNKLSYVIPRKDGIVLGGTSEKGEESLIVDNDLSKEILQECSKYGDDFTNSKILEVKVGLRPGRTEIRLEKDKDLNIIHNYGHGGAGFTVSWGCAKEVLLLTNAALGYA